MAPLNLGGKQQKLIFGSLADNDLLEQISQLFGEYGRRVSAHGDPASALLAALAKQSTPPHLLRHRNVEVSQLHGQAPGMANLVAMTPSGPTVAVIAAPPAYRVEPFASCQQAEAAVQTRLERGEVTGPDQLRAEAVLSAIVEQMDQREYARFKREQSALSERLTALVHAAPAAADEMRRRDPALAPRNAHMRHLLEQIPSRQAAMREEILRRFATGEMAHFSYVLDELPEAEITPVSPPKARKRLRREPDVYGTRSTSS